MSDQFKVALFRAFAGALLAGASTGLATVAVTSDLKIILVAALTPVIATLTSRFAAEGWIDTKAANKPTT